MSCRARVYRAIDASCLFVTQEQISIHHHDGIIDCCDDQIDAKVALLNFISFTYFSCPPGMTYDGSECEDINECETGEATCDINNQACLNTIGSYKCLNILTKVSNCDDGYRYQARIDQCVGEFVMSVHFRELLSSASCWIMAISACARECHVFMSLLRST
jgi:hypothetical protein